MNGYFVISLDFELHWGVFDKRTVNSYQKNLLGVRKVIPKLLKLSKKYNIKLTFSTVGFLFAENVEMLKKHNPSLKPTYKNTKLNPYLTQLGIGRNEDEDPYHYANSLLQLINKSGDHEIGTHTYSHYYCKEKGQNTKQFDADIKAAKSIAQATGFEIKSIVFPRNQYNEKYIKICKKNKLSCYRGNPNHFIYKPRQNDKEFFYIRALRLMDSYVNLSGTNTYKLNKTLNGEILNLPGSRFFRPYNTKLKPLEFLKLHRIKKGMQYAALHGEVFHLWWHPHNFGNHTNKNFNQLKEIFKEYKRLETKYNFQSISMSSLADKIL